MQKLSVSIYIEQFSLINARFLTSITSTAKRTPFRQYTQSDNCAQT